MFTGLKTELPEQIDHVPAYLGIGTILLLGTVGFSGHLVQNLDSNNRTVTILGTQFVLGEQEDGEHANKAAGRADMTPTEDTMTMMTTKQAA